MRPVAGLSAALGIIAAGVLLNIAVDARQPALPTRLSDGRIALQRQDLQGPEAEAVRPYRRRDYFKYLAMAERPFSGGLARGSHHGWRFLTPLAVHFLPFPRETGFYLLAVVAMALSGFFLFLFLENVFGLKEPAHYGLVAFYAWALSSPVSLASRFYLEITTLPFMILGLYAIDRRRYSLLAGVIAVGVLQRETVLLLGPVLLVREWAAGERSGRRLVRLAAFFIGVPSAILLIVHTLLPVPFDATAVIRRVWGLVYAPHLADLRLSSVGRFLMGPWGAPGLIAAALGAWPALRFLARRPHYALYIAAVYASLIFGPLHRYVVHAAPVFLACYLSALNAIVPDARLRAMVFTTLTGLQLAWTLAW